MLPLFEKQDQIIRNVVCKQHLVNELKGGVCILEAGELPNWLGIIGWPASCGA